MVGLLMTLIDDREGEKGKEGGNSPVNVPEVVNGLNSANDLGNVELSDIFRENIVVLTHQGEEVASRMIVHDEIKLTFILETTVQRGQPRMRTILVGRSKQHNVSLLFELGNLGKGRFEGGGLKDGGGRRGGRREEWDKECRTDDGKRTDEGAHLLPLD